jgi:dienelactone hydrolase
MKPPRHIGPGAALVVAGVLAFAGALLWARGRDPYVREWFTVPVPGGPAVRCLAVLPKPAKPRPVVVYLHGNGGSLVNDGRDLRRLAELGLAAVSVEYNQTNETWCAAQLAAVLKALDGRRWVDTKGVVWMGFSLGANRWLDFAARQEGLRPSAMVRLAGGPAPTNDAPAESLAGLPVLLVQGTEDEVFQWPNWPGPKRGSRRWARGWRPGGFRARSTACARRVAACCGRRANGAGNGSGCRRRGRTKGR